MKNIAKSFVILFLLLTSNVALSDIRSDANKVLNLFESLYPELLSPAVTQYVAEFCLRHYPEEEIYTGVVCGSEIDLPLGNGYVVIGDELIELGPIEQYRNLFASQSDADGSAPTGSSSCVNIPFNAHNGIIETLQITVNTPQGSTSINHVNEYLSVTNTSSTIKVTTSNISGLGDVSESTLTEHYQIQGNYLFHVSSTSTTTTNMFGTESTLTSASTVSPSYKSAPVNTYCAGQTWTTSAYTETTNGTVTVMGINSSMGSESIQQPGYSGIVSSVNQSVTVPAGTFNTIRIDYTMANGDRMSTWSTTDIGALVKMTISGVVDGQTYTGTTELLGLQR